MQLDPCLVGMSVVVVVDIPLSIGLAAVSVEHHSYHSTTRNTRYVLVNTWNKS